MSAPREPSGDQWQASELGSMHSALARGIVETTTMLVRQAACGAWTEVPMTLVARRALLTQLQHRDVGADGDSCLKALLAAVEESEYTLAVVAAQLASERKP